MPLPPARLGHFLPIEFHKNGAIAVLGILFARLVGFIATAIFNDEELEQLDGWSIHRSAGSDVVDVRNESWWIRFHYDARDCLWRQEVLRRGDGQSVSALQIDGPATKDGRPSEKSRVSEVPEFGEDILSSSEWLRSPLPVDREGVFTLGDRLTGVSFFDNGELNLPPDRVFTQAEAIENFRVGQYTVNRASGFRQVLEVGNAGGENLYFSFERDTWYQWRQVKPTFHRRCQNRVAKFRRTVAIPFDNIRETAKAVAWFIETPIEFVFQIYVTIVEVFRFVFTYTVVIGVGLIGAWILIAVLANLVMFALQGGGSSPLY